MKKIHSFILALSLVFSCFVPIKAAETIDGININLRGSDSKVTIDTENAYKGKSSLKIEKFDVEAAGRYLDITVPFAVEKGATYEYGFYAKAKKAVKETVMIDWGTRHTLTPVSSTYEWNKFKYEWKNQGGDGSTVIRFVFDGTVEGFWIDELYCYKVENGKKVGKNLVPNSGFEISGATADDETASADENGNLSSDDYFANIKKEKPVPIYPMNKPTIDGSLSDWENVVEIKPDEKLYYVKDTVPDLEVSFKIGYDDENLYYAVETTDDVYFSYGGTNYWSGDCIQFAISGLEEKFGTEFGMSWDPDTNAPYFSGVSDGYEIAITTSGKKRIYETSISWEAIFGEKPESFLFSMCAGDNDGQSRLYVVQTDGGGIAEGKVNTNFQHMMLMEKNDIPFMWTEGETALFEKDEATYRLNIVNPGEAQSIDVKIPDLDFEKTIDMPEKTHHIEYITKQFNKAGDFGLEVSSPQTPYAYGLNVSVAPTRETYATRISEVESNIEELETLFKKCEENNISTDYETINLTILKKYIPIIEEDIDNKNTDRFDYLFRVLGNIYTEARDNLNDYLSGRKTPTPATKMVTGKREVIGNTIWGNTITNGKEEYRPVFLVGYGAFTQAGQDVPIFGDLGMNYIQQEVGPSATVALSGEIKSWIGGGTNQNGDTSLSIHVTDEAAHSGEKAIKVVSDNPLTPNVGITMLQPVVVEPGKTYEFGCWIKGTNVNTTWLTAENWDNRKYLPNNASEWQELKYEYTAGDGGMINLRFGTDDIVDCLYVDDFFVREKGTEENLLLNPGFEEEGADSEFMGNVGGLNWYMYVLRNAEKNNVSMSVMLAPHYFVNSVFTKYPETQASTPGTIHFRVDNDKVREVVETHVRTLLEQIKDSPAVSDIVLTNEPCYSAVANTYYEPLWEEYLQKLYGTIENLNAVYRSEYTSFSEVKMPKSPEQTVKNYDYREFNDEIFADFHEWMADLVHEIAPDIPVHVKLMTGHFGPLSQSWHRFINYGYNIEEFMQFTDVIGMDGGDSYGGGSFDVTQFVSGSHLGYYSSLDMQTSLKNAPVYNTEDHIINDGSDNWVDAQAQHVGRHIWQGAVHGRGTSAIWVWARSYTDNALKNSILYRPDCILEAGRSSLDLNRLSYEVTALSNAERDVGILYSYTARNYDYTYEDCSFKVYSGFIWDGKRPLFVSEENMEPIENVKVFVVPNVKHTKKSTLDGLDKYLSNGGKVVIIGEDSLKYDEKDKPHDEALVESIYARSTVVPIESEETYTVTSPDSLEIYDLVQKLVEENNLEVVKVVDAKTGETPIALEWTSGYYNGKLLVNICNWGDYNELMDLHIYVRGKKVEKMKELRFNQILDDLVSVDAGKPVILEIDVDTTFNDTYNHWAEESVTNMQKQGIVSGVSEYRFAPDDTLTRAQWISLLQRACGKQQGSDAVSVSDISGHWAENDIKNAASAGILDGMLSDGKFDPDKNITREEMAKTLYLAMKANGKNLNGGETTNFADDFELNNKTEISAVVNAGLLSGYPDNTFGGKKGLTRAEAAVVLEKAMNM